MRRPKRCGRTISGRTVDEFSLIDRYLAPLAIEGAVGLQDDAALFEGMIITKDLLVDGVHFRSCDGWGAAAQKALRVNISDLVACGARPAAFALGVVWPKAVTEEEIAAFMEGLSADCARYGLGLIGGDTTRHRADSGPLTISVTMVGPPAPEGPLRRSGAQVGDVVMVTGTIGEAVLGLKSLLGEIAPTSEGVEAYLRPRPPIDLVDALARYAHAAIDISDGLLADATHIAEASGVVLGLDAAAIPLSPSARAYAEDSGDALLSLLGGGDDYQVIATVPQDNVDPLRAAAATAQVPLTSIGEVREGAAGTVLRGGDGKEIAFGADHSPAGFRHFP